MENQDLFPSDYIKVLEPPSNYIGPEKFLDEEISERTIEIIDDYDEILPLKHKNFHPIDVLPDGLYKAIEFLFYQKLLEI